MAYQSIDEIQRVLSQDIFGDRKDSKKAAGRALGTFIETIVFYLLRQWGENDSVSIESKLAEYGRQEITHNVEFTLHPIINKPIEIVLPITFKLTPNQIFKKFTFSNNYQLSKNTKKLVDKGVLQNACVIAFDDNSLLLVSPNILEPDKIRLHCNRLSKHPYAMIECKRVGKEGDAKGPQTIEKAKQGAYVAKVTSSLQKIRNDKGELEGIVYVNGAPRIGAYHQLLNDIIFGDDADLLRDFTLSIGVVSNHGNWFTSGNQNKEMKVLAQSYDWLLFLTDEGLSQFITDLLQNPAKEYQSIKDAFLASYSLTNGQKATNAFTKKYMELNAHVALDNYFSNNIDKIEKWFNVISPFNGTLSDLKHILNTLKQKKWVNIL